MPSLSWWPLDDQAEWEGSIGETVDEISSRLDVIGQGIGEIERVINNYATVFKDLCGLVRELNASLARLVNAFAAGSQQTRNTAIVIQ